MPLRLIDLLESRTGQEFGPESWLPAKRLLFIESQPAEVLRRELWRYLREEVPGRSFLIAGYRGAGKTTMVRRAVADVADAVLRSAIPGTAFPPASGQAAQRPLLVKLHGPSLFSAPRPETAPKAAAGAATDASADSADKTAGTGPNAGPSDERTRGAMQQITTGLYRALASEVAPCFRVHAIAPASWPAGGAQRPEELAAQLRLDLDTGPPPDMLRAYWRRLGRLESGVVWPQGNTLRPPDQGVREIIAVATAAQAFQVCIGAITYEKSRKDSGGLEEKVETQAKTNPQQALAPLFGLAGGGGLAAGLIASHVGPGDAAASGLAAGLLSALTLSFAGTRSRKRDETADYRFIRDISLTTLDRDLPEVIQRIRGAGLAPVFLVDELDKVTDADARLRELIDRLKNLTTDYGFFCFLTDRSYYERLTAGFRRGTYPKEFTYFSNLLVLGYDTRETLRYLLRVVRPDPAPGAPPPDKTDAAAWIIFAFAARHRSRLNGVALSRELARAFDETGAMRDEAVRSAGRPVVRLEAGIQLAIDLMANEVDEPLDADPLFPQRLIDALYRLSAAWNSNAPEVDLSPAALGAYLRLCSDAPEASDQAPPSADDPEPDQRLQRDLEILSAAAVRVAVLLEDLPLLSKWARRAGQRRH